jgi:hypothetical protein
MNNPVMSILNASSAAAPTTSLDLPPAIASILAMGPSTPMMQQPSGGLGATAMPSYEDGGMIEEEDDEEYRMPTGSGMGVGLAPQGAPTGASANPQMLEMQASQFAAQHPEQLAQIQQAIQQAMASGELTPEELNMVVQLATVAAQNPDMYPYVRKFAIQQGIATEQDLPQQYDQGLIIAIMIAAKALQSEQGAPAAQGMPMMTGSPMPTMKNGGAVPPSKKDDGAVVIKAHEGEYVIPAHVVKMKGREFFDSMLEKYSGMK